MRGTVITLLFNYCMGVMVALLKDRVVSDCATEVSLHACMVQVSSLYTVTDVCLYGSSHTSGHVVDGLGAMVAPCVLYIFSQ